jgi:hypothetical protein
MDARWPQSKWQSQLAPFVRKEVPETRVPHSILPAVSSHSAIAALVDHGFDHSKLKTTN